MKILDPESYYAATETLTFAGGILINAEILKISGRLTSTRSNGHDEHISCGGSSARSRDRTLGFAVLTALTCLRILFCLGGLWSECDGIFGTWWIGLYAITSWLSLLHPEAGHNASDEMHTLISLGLLGSIGGDAFCKCMTMIFIAAQLSVAYFTAAFIKIIGSEWRSGRALKNVMATQTFGNGNFVRFLMRSRRLVRVATYLLLTQEMLAGIALFMPFRFAEGVLVGAALFHLACARLMGLNTFIWAFGSAFPAVLYVSRSLWTS